MNSYLRLTPSLDSTSNLVKKDGLIVFRLGLWVDGKEVDHLAVYSGAPSRQSKSNLKTALNPSSIPGSLEPIPEGEFSVGGYEFAVPNSYAGSWGPGLGPVWFQLTPPAGTRRGDFGIHLDENKSYAAGSAGCVVTSSVEDLKTIVEWQKKYRFNKLVVDYGLGTVKKPVVNTPIEPPVEKEESSAFKIYINENGATLVLNSKLEPGEYHIFSSQTGLVGKLLKKKG